MPSSPWNYCLERLEKELPPDLFNTWVRPLQAEENNSTILLLAPNRFVKDHIYDQYFDKIHHILSEKKNFSHYSVYLEIGDSQSGRDNNRVRGYTKPKQKIPSHNFPKLDSRFTFDSFVAGKSNQLARAASEQVAENPGNSYNPLFIYGGVGLGKTHLMHAIGQVIIQKDKNSSVVYLHSERFVADMIRALRHNTIEEFKRYYRSAKALLIDDIQFFANKERSQEEFFHTFNALLEGQHQIVLTCDRYPKEVDGLENRLKSRFGCGLTVEIAPPELETRVAIIKSKAIAIGKNIPDEVSFFIADRFSSNVRELEGVMNRIVASSNLTQKPINIELAKDVLKDLLRIQDKWITIERIQKIIAAYYKIRQADILSKKRNRSIARPRQMAMKLAKEFTNHSLPEIGKAFGGRDHSTILHACRKIEELRKVDARLDEDYDNLRKSIES